MYINIIYININQKHLSLDIQTVSSVVHRSLQEDIKIYQLLIIIKTNNNF